jgi:hypothetical protein
MSAEIADIYPLTPFQPAAAEAARPFDLTAGFLLPRSPAPRRRRLIDS